MRLHLIIQRHGLPVTRVLWTTSSPTAASSNTNSAASSFATVSSSTLTSTRAPNAGFGAGAAALAGGSGGLTIAQLLEDVNEVIPLETQVGEEGGYGNNDGDVGGQWGLEDYVVEVQGSECLHFMGVDGLLRDGDEVVIRALQLGDLMARRLTGRHQISVDGKHLIDGVPFGRPYIQKASSSRPPITIPPRKKRRLNFGGWQDENRLIEGNYAGDEDDGDDEEDDPDWKEGGEGAGKELVLADEDEEDEDYADEVVDEGEVQALIRGQEEVNDAAGKEQFGEVSVPKISSQKQPDPQPMGNKLHGILDRKDRGPSETSSKRRLSVTFEEPPELYSKQPASSQKLSESDSGSNSDSEESSDDSSYDSSDEDEADSISSGESSSSDSSSDSSSAGSSSSESEAASIASITKSAVPSSTVTTPRVAPNPPGKGSRKTKNTNKRTKLRRTLSKLKEAGILHKDANFNDMRAWCDANPDKFPLNLNDNAPEIRTEEDQEQTEFEKKRAQLLRDIANGGVDVSPQSPRQVKLSPPQSMSTTPQVNGPDETPESSKRQSKLDIDSSRRLLFGSLGLKPPKTKEDEQQLREKLSTKATPLKTLSKSVSSPDLGKTSKDYIEPVENWEDRLILQATECIYEDVELSTPPFPFVQRWDKAAQAAIYEQKQGQKNNKKRKRKSQTYQENYYDEGQGQQQEWNGEEEYSYGLELDYGNDGAGDDQGPGQRHVNGVVNGVSNDREMRDANGPSATSQEKEDDLPCLPEDISTLKDAKETDVKKGAIIAFKQLDMSKATNWQPLVSGYRTAIVESVLKESTILVRLARRDRDQLPERDEDDDQPTQYSKFEMPGYDERDGEDDGVRDLIFRDLIEPKLISPGTADEGSVAVVEETQHIPIVVDLPAQLPPPIPEVITVSSPTRHEISQMMREAGFRSGFDSDFLPPEETFFTAQGSVIHENPNENAKTDEAASPTVQSPTFAGFPSSPPSLPIPLDGDDSLLPAASAPSTPRRNEMQVTTEVPSSVVRGNAMIDMALLAPFLRPGSDHQRSPVLSDDQLQYLETNGNSVQDSLAPIKDMMATSELGTHVDETNLETGPDTGPKSVLDSVVEDSHKEELNRTSHSPAIIPTSPPSYQPGQAVPPPEDDSLFSTIPSTVDENQRPGSRAGSIITNPFYESDRNLSASPSMPKFSSTAPARTTTAVLNSPSGPPPTKNKRKVVSSPCQRSPSPSQNYDDPSILDAGRESTPQSEYVPKSQPPESSYVVDLTISSDLESPGNSDGDFAESQGLPRGPGWVKKRVPSSRQGRGRGRGRGDGQGDGRGSGGRSSSEAARRASLRRRRSVI
ncbi:hypothetical protein FQN55_009693 [Onygenales sp. PD_40]|nr:hypothetical protein FQN55_009693 [Onygenales sp. PD_40]KAK2784460.1 hypothetical protein FQN51_004080 [Onygenales sp. PD_10]